MIVAGEASGDMHAARLVDALGSLDSSIVFSGVGGQNMKQSGVDIFHPLADLAVVGFTEVAKNYRALRKIFYQILKKARETNVDAVILVDFPGFNLRLAKALKKEKIKVIYYISPQVWAWKENRVRLIKRYVDKMIVFFFFEKELYKKYGFAVEWVGHPLIDTIHVNNQRDPFLEAIGLSKNKLTIGILPGSRAKEVERLLPVMLKSAKILQENHNQIQFLLMRASTISEDTLNQYIQNNSLPLKIIDKEAYYEGLNSSDLCMVTSGTATLETAILEKPMVVVYKTSFLTWLLAKLLIKIPFIGLVNVVAGKKIVPECIQFGATSNQIAQHIMEIIQNEIKATEIRQELRKVKAALGMPGASKRAAEEILKAVSS